MRLSNKNADVYACLILIFLSCMVVLLMQLKRDPGPFIDESIEMTDELKRKFGELKKTHKALVEITETESEDFYAKKEDVIFPYTEKKVNVVENEKIKEEEKKLEIINIDLIISQTTVPTVLIDGKFLKIGDKLNTGEKLYKVNTDSIEVKASNGKVRTIRMKTQRNNASDK
jgi:hypothetical protein